MIYMFLADGFEETEAIATLDMIRRGDILVQTVSCEKDLFVTGNHGITVKADIGLGAVSLEEIDGIVLPGGMPGTLNLKNNKAVEEIILYCFENKKLLSAICAAPMILGNLGLLEGQEATCFPGFEQELHGAKVSDAIAVTSDNFITGKGMGAAVIFGAHIINYFKPNFGEKVLKQIHYA